MRVEEIVAKRYRDAGFITYTRGWPDLLAVRTDAKGKTEVIIREIKSPTDKLRPEQIEILSILQSLGLDAKALWVDTGEETLGPRGKTVRGLFLERFLRSRKITPKGDIEDYQPFNFIPQNVKKIFCRDRVRGGVFITGSSVVNIPGAKLPLTFKAHIIDEMDITGAYVEKDKYYIEYIENFHDISMIERAKWVVPFKEDPFEGRPVISRKE